ncbi:MAG: NosD domain-containing protein [Candidatus Hodarchaeales archaeon]|jgi:parallel beta-helix repeat protein
MNKKVVIGLVIFLCIMLGTSQLSLHASNKSNNIIDSVQQARKVKYDPISIKSNKDFSRQAKRNGWPGSGTISDPFKIESYDLIIPYTRGKKSVVPPAAISIKNTDVYFIIQYSTISNFNGEVDGIFLQNVIHGTIFNNTILNFVNGIFLVESHENYILNNSIQSYNDFESPISQNTRFKVDRIQSFISRGVFLDPSNNNVIANNTISGFTGTGVELLDSSNNLIDWNVIDTSIGVNGMFLNGSHYNNITNNDIYNSEKRAPLEAPISSNIRYKIGRVQSFISRGVFLDPSNYNIIANNTISGYTGTGVELQDSSKNLLDWNMIDNSDGRDGVFLAGSHYNNITNNDIYNSNPSTPTNAPISSSNIRYKIGRVQSYISRGVFLDPSNYNIIANNTISGYNGTGIELEDSSKNLIDGNEINNTIGRDGVFLAGSDYNNITNNDVWGSYIDPTSMSPLSQNIRYKINRVQSFISRGVFLDPSSHNIIANNTISNITGPGLYLLASLNNTVSENEIGNNEAYGILLQNSSISNISNNVIYNDGSHGVSLSDTSTSNIIDFNDFIGNNIGGSSQINDDGSGNQFSSNFMVDHDNTDNNNDNVSDSSYFIDGGASTVDSSPNTLPVQPIKDLGLTFADLEANIDYESETLNLKNEGKWETVKISLPVGYSATNINVSSVYTDGEIYAEEAQVQNAKTLIVKFNRSELVDYLLEAYTTFPVYDAQLNVTGFLNGAFLMFKGYDTVKLLNSDSANPVMNIAQINESPSQITRSSSLPGMSISILFAPLIAIAVIQKKKKV